MKSQQLDLLTSVSVPTIDPTGRTAVVATSRANFSTDSYTGQLWQLDTAGEAEPRRITSGKSDRAPQFSPDGTLVAFVRPDEKGRPQIAVVDARGGEPRIITDRPLGVGSFVWSSDSRQIAFVAATPEYGRYGTVDGVGAGAENPRRVTENKVRANGPGWSFDRKPALFVIEIPALTSEPYFAPVGRAKDILARAGSAAGSAAAGAVVAGSGAAGSAESGAAASDSAEAHGFDVTLPGAVTAAQAFPKARLLSDPNFAVSSPVFGANNEHIYFVSAQHDGADNDLTSAIYRVAVADAVEFTAGAEQHANAPAAELVVGGGEKNLSLGAPAFSADYATLYVLGQDVGETGIDFVARNTGVWATSVSELPVAVPTLLTNVEDVDYGDVHSTLVTDGDSVLAFARLRGAGQLHRVTAGAVSGGAAEGTVSFDASSDGADAADGSVTVLSEGPRVITGAATANGVTVVSYSDPTTPGETAALRDGALHDLTDFAAALHEHTVVVEQIEYTATSPDGYPVHGWIYKPQGDGPHPVLLNIHGGPFADYHWAYFDEAQAYAQAGYAVLQCNPRGSAGYGQEHGRAIRQQMGTLDMDDVLSFFEQAVAADPDLDGDRAGVLGGSYGGYLTAWIIGHDHRFKGAIVERGFLDPFSFVGTSDIGWFFGDEYTGTDPDTMRSQSPMECVAQVQTPTLVMHSEEDLRCPLEQAQRYYASLKRAGVESEMLVFPGENHELSRAGTPWHRMQRFDAILEWWQRHLPVEA